MTQIAAPPPIVPDADALQAARRWIGEDGRVAVATVIATWGSAPVPVGGQMAVASGGRFQGSVSGGCIENDVIVEAEETLASGVPRTLEFGVSDETAWRAGLPCGGRIRVFVERYEGPEGADLIGKAVAARQSRRGLVVRTRLGDGAREVFETRLRAPDGIRDRFHTGESGIVEVEGGEAFIHAIVPPARVIIVGAGHIGQVLAQLVRITGYELIVLDPRDAYASRERFGDVEIIAEWPQDALPRIGLDPFTAVVALAHVGHIDDEALKLALRSDCLYVGALGSRRNHAKRVERLRAAGLTETQIARLHAPIGLDIGARSPPEIAVSIMAQIIAAVRGAGPHQEQGA
jgi:xanthine dehydrogenase accessory factor